MSERTQAEYWNDEAGPKWVQHADALDEMLSPFLTEIISRAKLRATDSVLDVGCGGGALSLKAAETAGAVLGVDVSEPLLSLARQRAQQQDNVGFHFDDAAALSGEGHALFDVALSRFGVMFFENPVAAFGNILSLMGEHPTFVFACWRHPTFNPWATLPIQTVAPLLPNPPEPPNLEAPGPFAFSDRDRMRSTLREAGWANMEINAFDIDLVLPGHSAEETASFMVEMGPLGRLLSKTPLDLDVVKARLRETLSQFTNEDGRVQCGSSAWIVEAGR